MVSPHDKRQAKLSVVIGLTANVVLNAVVTYARRADNTAFSSLLMAQQRLLSLALLICSAFYFVTPGVYFYDIFDWNSISKSMEFILISSRSRAGEALVTNNLIAVVSYAGLNISLTYRRHESLTSADRMVVAIMEPSNENEVWDFLAHLATLFQYTGRLMIFILWPGNENHTKPDSAFMDRRHNEILTNEYISKYKIATDLYCIFQTGAQKIYENGSFDGIRFKVYELYAIQSFLFFEEVPLTEELICFENIVKKLNRRSNFLGLEVPAIGKDDESLRHEVTFTSDSTSMNATFQSGSAVEVYWNLRDMLNFTERAVMGGFGGGRRATTVVKQLHQLFENDGTNYPPQLCISQMAVQEVRSRNGKFLQPTSFDQGVTAIFMQPSQTNFRNIFLLPFDWFLWITMCATWVAIFITSAVAEKVCTKIGRGYIHEVPTEWSSYLWAVAAMCQRSFSSTPSLSPVRIPYIIGSTLAFIVYTAYAAAITSVLAVKTIPIQSFQDLVDNTFSFYSHEKSTSVQAFMQDTLIPSYNLAQPVLLTDTQQEVSMLSRYSLRALLSYLDNFYAAAKSLGYSDEYVCEQLDRIPVYRNGVKYAMIVPTGSPFREIFDHKIMKMKERGYVNRYLKSYALEAKPSCPTWQSHIVDPVDLVELYWAFLFVLNAIAMGFLLLAFESLFWRISRGDANILF